jgi:hypothetical protein
MSVVSFRMSRVLKPGRGMLPRTLAIVGLKDE